MKLTIRSLITASLLFAAAAAYAAPLPTASDSDDPAYAAGTKALNDHRYPDAVTEFDKVAKAKGNQADAALYWKAYALNKLHRGNEAAATCNQLRASYSNSSWNKDCSALALVTGKMITSDGKTYVITGDGNVQFGDFPPLAAFPGVNGDPIGRGAYYIRTKDRSEDPETEMKILALNAVLRDNPDKALPELRNMLSGNASPGMKKHALFVLAQSKNPEAQKILDDAIRGKMGPEIQQQAISTVPLFQGKRVNDALVDAYKTSNDPKLKNAVITGLFISQDAPHLVDLARSEKDLETKRRIVSQLALMHDKAAQDYMLELLK